MTPFVRGAVFHFLKWRDSHWPELSDDGVVEKVGRDSGIAVAIFARYALEPEEDAPGGDVLNGAGAFLKEYCRWDTRAFTLALCEFERGTGLRPAGARFAEARGVRAHSPKEYKEYYKQFLKSFWIPVKCRNTIELTVEELENVFYGRAEFEKFHSPCEVGFLKWVDSEETTDTEEKKEGDQKMTTGAISAVANDKNEVFKRPQLVREGEKIILPKGMTCSQGIEALKRQQAEDEREVSIDEVVEASLFEGLFAFQRAMAHKFGWVDFVPTPGFFGDTPPTTITIEIGVGTRAQVFWGRVQVPGITGFLQTGYTIKKGRVFFRIGGTVKQRDRQAVAELANLTRNYVNTQSIYRGKAIEVTFPDMEQEGADITECPKFIDTSKIDASQLIFSRDLQEEVEMHMFNPVEYTDRVRALGNTLKRGVLLAGPYGTGKTLAARILARKCTDNDWTYLYLKEPKDLPKALLMAQQYQPAVVFVEDIDRVVTAERNQQVDTILNTLDGMDTKDDEVMVVFTTNHLERINDALLRAKRLDATIEVTPPDQEAVKRLIKKYTRGHLSPSANLAETGNLLKGQISATIEEVCKRAQLAAVKHMESDSLVLTDKDLETAARSVLKQIKLTSVPKKVLYSNDVEKAAEMLGDKLNGTVSSIVQMISSTKTNGTPKAVSPLPSHG